MTLNSLMTPLMDKAREITGITEKISIAQLTSLMNHFDLHVNPNLLSSTTWTTVPNINYPTWPDTQLIDSLKPGTYTFSWKAVASSKLDKTIRVRVHNKKNDSVPSGLVWAGNNFRITSQKTSFTFTVPDDGGDYELLIYGSAVNASENDKVTFYNCKLEVGDLATPITTVGGGVIKRLLYSLVTQKIGGACYVA